MATPTQQTYIPSKVVKTEYPVSMLLSLPTSAPAPECPPNVPQLVEPLLLPTIQWYILYIQAYSLTSQSIPAYRQ